MLRRYFFWITLFLVAAMSYGYFSLINNEYKAVTSFEECVSAGFMVTPTYPEICKIPGKSFTNPKQLAVMREEKEKLVPLEETASDSRYLNLAYFIDGEKVQFLEGSGTVAEDKKKASPATILTASGTRGSFDINEDKKQDSIFFILVGTTTTYISAAMSLSDGYVGLNSIKMPKVTSSTTIAYINKEIVVTYKEQEALKKKFIRLEENTLKEISH